MAICGEVTLLKRDRQTILINMDSRDGESDLSKLCYSRNSNHSEGSFVQILVVIWFVTYGLDCLSQRTSEKTITTFSFISTKKL